MRHSMIGIGALTAVLVASTAAVAADPVALTGKVWAWTGSKGDSGAVEVPEPERYTVSFTADGDARMRFDCNRGGGRYVLDGDRLSFGPLMSTRAACPEGSLDARFLDGLGRVVSYRIDDGTLTLRLGGEGGTMEFRVVAADDPARAMAQLSIDSGSFARALDRGAEVTLESTVEPLELRLGRNLRDDERDRVRGILRSALAEVVPVRRWEQALSEVYREHFSEGEIAAALEFYRSPVGRKILEQDDAMSREVEQRIVAWFETRLDDFSQRVDAALAEAFPDDPGEASR